LVKIESVVAEDGGIEEGCKEQKERWTDGSLEEQRVGWMDGRMDGYDLRTIVGEGCEEKRGNNQTERASFFSAEACWDRRSDRGLPPKK